MLNKVRPLLNMLREACLKVEPEEKMSNDEQIIPFKGKNKLKQYIPKKPKKWGIKVLACCGFSGITYDFMTCMTEEVPMSSRVVATNLETSS